MSRPEDRQWRATVSSLSAPAASRLAAFGGGRPRATRRLDRADRTLRLGEPATPIFPRALDRTRSQIVFRGKLRFLRGKRPDTAEHMRTHLEFGIANRIDRTEHHFVQITAGNGRAVAAHQHYCMRTEGASE